MPGRYVRVWRKWDFEGPRPPGADERGARVPYESTVRLLEWMPGAVRALMVALDVSDYDVAEVFGWEASEVDERLPELMFGDAFMVGDLAGVFGLEVGELIDYAVGGTPPPGVDVPADPTRAPVRPLRRLGDG